MWPACLDLIYSAAPRVGVGRTTDPAPVALGGTVAGGTYHLTAMMYHGGIGSTAPCNEVDQEVTEIEPLTATEGTIRLTQAPATSIGSPRSYGWRYTTSGSTMSDLATCGDAFDKTDVYTATANQVVFIRQVDAGCWQMGTLEMTYTKQQ